jgi:hypothetical protein
VAHSKSIRALERSIQQIYKAIAKINDNFFPNTLLSVKGIVPVITAGIIPECIFRRIRAAIPEVSGQQTGNIRKPSRMI